MLTQTKTKEIQHLQDLFALESIKQINDPFLKAIAFAFFRKKIANHWYQIEENEEIQSFTFALLGFHREPRLDFEGLWWKKCRYCQKRIPALVLRKEIALKEVSPRYYSRYEENVQSLSAIFTLECGQKFFDGFLSPQDLLKRRGS